MQVERMMQLLLLLAFLFGNVAQDLILHYYARFGVASAGFLQE
jgi:hypothetical protein